MSATFEARALFGPPRPVLVLSVTGEIDRSNDEQFRRLLSTPADLRGTDRFRQHFGCREPATTLVVDLRETTFINGRALTHLAQQRDRDGRTPRLVVASSGVVRQALDAAGFDGLFEIYSDITDAVLADVRPHDRD